MKMNCLARKAWQNIAWDIMHARACDRRTDENLSLRMFRADSIRCDYVISKEFLIYLGYIQSRGTNLRYFSPLSLVHLLLRIYGSNSFATMTRNDERERERERE